MVIYEYFQHGASYTEVTAKPIISQPVSTSTSYLSDGAISFINFNGVGEIANITEGDLLSNPAVLCAVRTVAEDVAAVPIKLYKRSKTENGKSKREVVEDHWAAELLRNPNEYMTRRALIEFIIVNCMLDKGALLIKTQRDGVTTELNPAASGWTRNLNFNRLDGYYYTYDVTYEDGSTAELHQNDVVFIQGLSKNVKASISIDGALRNAVSTARLLDKQRRIYIETGGVPKSMLTSPNKIDPKQREGIQASLAANKSGISIFDDGMDWKPMAGTLQEAQFTDAQEFQILQIAQALKVHPSFLMATKAPRMGNYKEINQYHVEKTIVPFVERLEQEFTLQILRDLRHEGYLFDGDTKSLLRGNAEAQSKVNASGLGVGGHQSYLTVNEIRESEGRDPIDEPWADVPSRGGYEVSAGATETPKTEEVIRQEIEDEKDDQ